VARNGGGNKRGKEDARRPRGGDSRKSGPSKSPQQTAKHWAKEMGIPTCVTRNLKVSAPGGKKKMLTELFSCSIGQVGETFLLLISAVGIHQHGLEAPQGGAGLKSSSG